MPAWLAMPLAVGAVLLVLLTLPVSLPLIGLLHAFDGRRLRAAAARTCCVHCGQVLGQPSLDAADAAWATEMADMHRRFPGARLRVVRDCHALCAVCGMEYGWNNRDRTLRSLASQERACDDGRPEPTSRDNRTGPSTRAGTPS